MTINCGPRFFKMGAVHAKSPTGVQDDGLTIDNEKEAAVLLKKPVTVDRVHVEGLRRTKNDIIVPEVQKILDAQTFGEVIAVALEVRETLQELGVFQFVDLMVDTSSGPQGHKNGLDVTIQVKEKRMVTGNAGTQVGNNEGSMVFGCILNNLFGRAESLKSNIGFGTRTRTSYQRSIKIHCKLYLLIQIRFPTEECVTCTMGGPVNEVIEKNGIKKKALGEKSLGVSVGKTARGALQMGSVKFDKPFPSNLEKSFSLGIHKSTTECFHSSYSEASQGVNAEFMFPSILGQHSIGWDGTWREVTGLKNTTSFIVREQAGHSLKSAVQHTFVHDGRDNSVFPTAGSYFKFFQEYAGVGGDVNFVKNSFEFQENLETFKDWIFSWSLQGGILMPLRKQHSRINDRFFLGGPHSIRGYEMKGIGPRDEGDALGSDAFWATGVHLFTPLPFRPGEGGFGDRIRTHFFVNAGNLFSLDYSKPWRRQINSLMENKRCSYGAGLVFLLGVARVEVNYCVPVGAQSKDRINHGLQVGVGLNFL